MTATTRNLAILGSTGSVGASTLDTEMASDANRWRRVTRARVCLLMRTADNAADAPVAYHDCTGTLVVPTDRRIRRAIVSTVSLRNRTTVGTTVP